MSAYLGVRCSSASSSGELSGALATEKASANWRFAESDARRRRDSRAGLGSASNWASQLATSAGSAAMTSALNDAGCRRRHIGGTSTAIHTSARTTSTNIAITKP